MLYSEITAENLINSRGLLSSLKYVWLLIKKKMYIEYFDLLYKSIKFQFKIEEGHLEAFPYKLHMINVTNQYLKI